MDESMTPRAGAARGLVGRTRGLQIVHCFDPMCTRSATEQKRVLIGGRLELLWACFEHELQCLAPSCTRRATEQRVLLADGKLERVRACQRHAVVDARGRRSLLDSLVPARR